MGIVRDLERLQVNIPKYHAFPEVVVVLLKKREVLETAFLDHLQEIRLKEGYCELYGLYTDWYKKYKKVEFL